MYRLNCGHVAIAAVMAVSCAFGYVLRGIIDRDRKDHREWFLNGLSADHDRWEDDPEPSHACDTCKWIKKPFCEEPCISCFNHRNWERKHITWIWTKTN